MKVLIKNASLATDNTSLFNILVDDKEILKVFSVSESINKLDFDQV
ncbi:hypothetical protein [Lactococcus lactis]|nr:hypothetical protein [Lactococcus lactis]MDG4959781.1 hypothetical protein [Lactococcus lactis]